jgi:hypothetical protein
VIVYCIFASPASLSTGCDGGILLLFPFHATTKLLHGFVCAHLAGSCHLTCVTHHASSISSVGELVHAMFRLPFFCHHSAFAHRQRRQRFLCVFLLSMLITYLHSNSTCSGWRHVSSHPKNCSMAYNVLHRHLPGYTSSTPL